MSDTSSQAAPDASCEAFARGERQPCEPAPLKPLEPATCGGRFPSASAPAAKASQQARLTPKMAWLLAAPHTWPASILPVLIASSFAYATSGALSVSMTCALLVICVLMQSAVNTLNDYFDYVKGTDSKKDNVDPSDAVLVYNNVSPASALRLAVGMLVAAFALGLYAIAVAGWIPLAIALLGALVVFLYSGGATPISYLPVGELVSGLVMGGLIPLACYQVLTGAFSWIVLAWSIPTIIGIGLIMLTNNTCDIEKDAEARRKTLPVLLGRKRSARLYHALMYAWAAAIVIIVGVWFAGGLVVVPFMLLAIYPIANALRKNPLVNATRIGAMAQICSLNVALGAFYAAAVFASRGMVLAF